MIFGTAEGTPFIFPGTGTGGWEAALTNTLSPGDKVVTFRRAQRSAARTACLPSIRAQFLTLCCI